MKVFIFAVINILLVVSMGCAITFGVLWNKDEQKLDTDKNIELIDVLEEENKLLKEMEIQYQVDIYKLEERIKGLESDIDLLNLQINEHKQNVRNLESEISKKIAMINIMNNEIENLENENTEKFETINVLNNEIENLNIQINEHEETIEGLQKEVSSYADIRRLLVDRYEKDFALLNNLIFNETEFIDWEVRCSKGFFYTYDDVEKAFTNCGHSVGIGEYLLLIQPNVSVNKISEFLFLKDKSDLIIKNIDGEIIGQNENVGTSYYLEFGQTKINFVMIGDISCDGDVSITDLAKLNQFIYFLSDEDKNVILNTYCWLAYDFNRDGEINDFDFYLLNLYCRGEVNVFLDFEIEWNFALEDKINELKISSNDLILLQTQVISMQQQINDLIQQNKDLQHQLDIASSALNGLGKVTEIVGNYCDVILFKTLDDNYIALSTTSSSLVYFEIDDITYLTGDFVNCYTDGGLSIVSIKRGIFIAFCVFDFDNSVFDQINSFTYSNYDYTILDCVNLGDGSYKLLLERFNLNTGVISYIVIGNNVAVTDVVQKLGYSVGGQYKYSGNGMYYIIENINISYSSSLIIEIIAEDGGDYGYFTYKYDLIQDKYDLIHVRLDDGTEDW